MSLMLRKNCQKILDDNGLQNYHVEIRDGSMVIAGECGATFCTVKGVQFSRKTPTKGEIDFASDLFDAYLAKHLPAIRDVIAAQKSVNDSEEKDPVLLYESEKFTASRSYGGRLDIAYKKYNIEFLMRKDGTVEICSGKVPMKEINNFLPDKEMIQLYNKHIIWIEKHDALLDALEEKLKALHECAI